MGERLSNKYRPSFMSLLALFQACLGRAHVPVRLCLFFFLSPQRRMDSVGFDHGQRKKIQRHSGASDIHSTGLEGDKLQRGTVAKGQSMI